jgi:predicted nucleic acid-binding Zn ribbon protein
MDDFSLNKALNKTISESRWGKRFLAISIKEDWAKIMGDTIAKYTRELSLKDQCLNITTDIAPLKNELSLNKKSIIDKINAFYKKEIVKTIEIH